MATPYDPETALVSAVPSAATTATLTAGRSMRKFRVYNRNGAAEVWWTYAEISKQGASAATTPVAATGDVYYLPGVAGAYDEIALPYPVSQLEVQVIVESTTTTVAVVGYPDMGIPN